MKKWQRRQGCTRRQSVSVPVGRDRKIQTALRTNQMAGFVTMSSEKNKYIYLHIINMKIYIFHVFFSNCNVFENVQVYLYNYEPVCFLHLQNLSIIWILIQNGPQLLDQRWLNQIEVIIYRETNNENTKMKHLHPPDRPNLKKWVSPFLKTFCF